MFKAVYCIIICSARDELLQYLPAFMALTREFPGFHHYVMNYVGHDHTLMKHIYELWPDLFRSGLEMSLRASLELLENSGKKISNWTSCTNLETVEYASIVFSSFLKEAPFYILLPALIFCGQESCSQIKELLLSKVSNLTTEQYISSLRLVLFWFHQIHLSYRKRPCEQHEWRSEVYYRLVEHFLGLLSSTNVDCTSSEADVVVCLSLNGQEIANTVFVHPAITSALSYSLNYKYELTEEIIKDCSEGLLRHSLEKMCKLDILAVKLLTITCESLLALCCQKNSSSVYTDCKENIVKSFKTLVESLFSIFKERFNLWYDSQNLSLLPMLCAIVALMCFISPIDLLELANWIITRVEHSGSMPFETSNPSPVCLAFSMAGAAFDMLSQFVQSLDMEAVVNQSKRDASLFRSIYLKAFHFMTVSRNNLAEICFIKALKVTGSLIHQQELLPFSIDITRVITCSPTNIVSHWVYGISSTKAHLLCLLIELSLLHYSVFGRLLSETSRKGYVQEENSDQRVLAMMFHMMRI